MEKDVDAVSELTHYYREIFDLQQHLDDSILLAGGKAYVAVLAFYNTVKRASKLEQLAQNPFTKISNNASIDRFPFTMKSWVIWVFMFHEIPLPHCR